MHDNGAGGRGKDCGVCGERTSKILWGHPTLAIILLLTKEAPREWEPFHILSVRNVMRISNTSVIKIKDEKQLKSNFFC